MNRFFALAAMMITPGLASPPLTTIQDTLFKADGTRFSGALTITWKSFQGPDDSEVPQQATTVKVVNGLLSVQLVPNTTAVPAAAYSVRYTSDGKFQFEETWSVPYSTRALRVRDVRVPPASLVAPDTSGPTIQVSDVIGLPADLGSRPLKSATYTAGRTVFVSSQGTLETIAGTPTDCVRVDGSSGPCGVVDLGFADGDTPAGIVDGSNVVFTLAGTPSPAASLSLYRNGLLMKAGQDFAADGRTVTFFPTAAPQPGDTLLANYRLSAVANLAVAQLFPLAQTLCSGTGAVTNSLTPSSLGVCTVPAGLLTPGDRLEVRYEVVHAGSARSFHVEVRWGTGGAVETIDGGPEESMVNARLEAAIAASGAQIGWQSWGTVLPFAAGIAQTEVSGAAGLKLEFFGYLVGAGSDTVGLRSFSVIRFP